MPGESSEAFARKNRSENEASRMATNTTTAIFVWKRRVYFASRGIAPCPQNRIVRTNMAVDVVVCVQLFALFSLLSLSVKASDNSHGSLVLAQVVRITQCVVLLLLVTVGTHTHKSQNRNWRRRSAVLPATSLTLSRARPRYHNTSSLSRSSVTKNSTEFCIIIGVTNMLRHLEWQTLEQRRIATNPTMLYKITNNIVTVPIHTYRWSGNPKLARTIPFI